MIMKQKISSLRSRRFEVVGERENWRARGVSPRVSPSRAPVFSRAHYFQAPATQANNLGYCELTVLLPYTRQTLQMFYGLHR